MSTKLESLTQEQEALLDSVAEEYIALQPAPMNLEVIEKWVAAMYSMTDLPKPQIEVFKSPFAALARATELTGTKQSSTDYIGIADAGWVSFYDYFNRIGVLDAAKEETAQLLAMKAYLQCVWDSVLLDSHALLVQYPTLLARDADGRMHSATGPCIEWADGAKDYAWHGVWVPERVIFDPRSYSKSEFMEASTEIRRAIGEAAGWDFVIALLGTTSASKWADEKTGLSYELLRSDNGDQWLRKESPRLQNGNAPFYIEPVHEDLKTAQAARKWQATRLSVRECESDPVLSYGQET